MNQDMLYEEYGSQGDYPCEINCIMCRKLIMFATTDMTPVIEEVGLMCPRCKEKLP